MPRMGLRRLSYRMLEHAAVLGSPGKQPTHPKRTQCEVELSPCGVRQRQDGNHRFSRVRCGFR